MIPIITRVMPEKNEAAGSHQYHGSGQGPLSGQDVNAPEGPPIRPSINRKIPRTMSANPSVLTVYLSNRGIVLPLESGIMELSEKLAGRSATRNPDEKERKGGVEGWLQRLY
jgi:hypothetical protein